MTSCDPPVMSSSLSGSRRDPRARSVPAESERALDSFVWRIFLSANRRPLRRNMRQRTPRGAPKGTAHFSDRERHALGRHDRSGTHCGGLGGDAVEEAVVVIGIVMEDRYLADVRYRREPNAFLPARMAPTDAR